MDDRRSIVIVLVILVLGAAVAGVLLYTGTRTPTTPGGGSNQRRFPPITDAQLIPDPRMRSWIFGEQPEMLSGSRQVKEDAEKGNAETMTITFKTATAPADLLPQYREYMIQTGWTVTGSSDDPRSTFIAALRRYQLLNGNTSVTVTMSRDGGFTIVMVTMAGPEPVRVEEES